MAVVCLLMSADSAAAVPAGVPCQLRLVALPLGEALIAGLWQTCYADAAKSVPAAVAAYAAHIAAGKLALANMLGPCWAASRVARRVASASVAVVAPLVLFLRTLALPLDHLPVLCPVVVVVVEEAVVVAVAVEVMIVCKLVADSWVLGECCGSLEVGMVVLAG